MKVKTCVNCGEFYKSIEVFCPHCSTYQDTTQTKSNKKFSSAAMLLGLALTGCGDKTEDTSADTASSEPTDEPAVEPPYGVPAPDTAEPDENN